MKKTTEGVHLLCPMAEAESPAPRANHLCVTAMPRARRRWQLRFTTSSNAMTTPGYSMTQATLSAYASPAMPQCRQMIIVATHARSASMVTL